MIFVYLIPLQVILMFLLCLYFNKRKDHFRMNKSVCLLHVFFSFIPILGIINVIIPIGVLLYFQLNKFINFYKIYDKITIFKE